MPDVRSAQQRAAGEGTGTAVGAEDDAITTGESFVWKSGRAEVTLSRASDGWIVVYTAIGRLLGPPHVIYSNRHRDAVHAAWDVMARVRAVSDDAEKGLRVGQSAAKWIKTQPRWSDFPGGGQRQPSSPR
jgi:hypothetical protein